MFCVSLKNEPYFYKAQRVWKGTTSTGKEYTIVSVSAVDKKNGGFKDSKLYCWERIDIDEGDRIAVHAISGWMPTMREYGMRTYVGCDVFVARYTVQKGEQQGEQQPQRTSKPKPQQQVPQQKATPAPQPTPEPKTVQREAQPSAPTWTAADDDDWNDLPF